MKLNKMREEMADCFLKALKEDKIPWHQNWSSMTRPYNVINNSIYRGVNAFWLSYKQKEMGYQDSRWCTYKQANEKGWRIKKGEKGTKVEFWSLYDTKMKKTLSWEQGEKLKDTLAPEEFYTRVKPVAKVYTVFNGEQIEGIPEIVIERYVLDKEMLIEKRDALLKNMAVGLKEGKEEAFYSPKDDCIYMPDMERFENEYAYMSTFFHEAGHATGHESRMSREIRNSFGSAEYAKEELRAEIASAFTAQILNLPGADLAPMENHKAYVQSWIDVLENNPDELFAAIRDAEKISDYLIEKGEFLNKIKERVVKQEKTVTGPDADRVTNLDANQGKKQQQEKEIKRTQGTGKRFYTKEESEVMVQYLKENISIVNVCIDLGYTPVRVGQVYYTLKEHDSVRLDVRKNSFFRNSTGEKGSVVDACIALGDMDKAEAFSYLYRMAGGKDAVYKAVYGNNSGPVFYKEPKKENAVKEKEVQKTVSKEVELPPKGATSRNVYAYLGKTRQISGDVINEFFERNMLYQDNRNNCVFVSRDEKGKPVFACKRGTSTYKRFIADCLGNDYNKGFYVDNGADKLFVGESVIDIMSKMSLLQEEGLDYHEYNYHAMAGTQKQDSIINTLKKHPEIREVTLGLDNDAGGIKAMHEIISHLEEQGVQVKKDIPILSGQDWNDALRTYREAGQKIVVHQETIINAGVQEGKVFHPRLLTNQEIVTIRMALKGKQVDYKKWDDTMFLCHRAGLDLMKYEKQGIDVKQVLKNKLPELMKNRWSDFETEDVRSLICQVSARNNEEYQELLKETEAHPESECDIFFKNMNDTESIYQSMTEAEKEVYDMNLDYGNAEGAKHMIEEKRLEMEKTIFGKAESREMANDIFEKRVKQVVPAKSKMKGLEI